MARSLKGKTDFERLMYLLARTKDVGECKMWQGAVIKTSGYGQAFQTLVHRAVYALVHGDIPKGMIVMHSCDNKLCINPDHLSLGTQRDNIHDCLKKGRFTHTRHNGEMNGRTKLTDQQVSEIRRLYSEGQNRKAEKSYTYKELGDMFGVGVSQIARIVHNVHRLSDSGHITVKI